IWRLRRRRSRSESPPQIPNLSSCSSAYSKHSSRTAQAWQMRLASRVDPPFSGKNASGSVCAHKAWSCHSCSTAPKSSSSVISAAAPPRRMALFFGLSTPIPSSVVGLNMDWFYTTHWQCGVNNTVVITHRNTKYRQPDLREYFTQPTKTHVINHNSHTSNKSSWQGLLCGGTTCSAGCKVCELFSGNYGVSRHFPGFLGSSCEQLHFGSCLSPREGSWKRRDTC